MVGAQRRLCTVATSPSPGGHPSDQNETLAASRPSRLGAAFGVEYLVDSPLSRSVRTLPAVPLLDTADSLPSLAQRLQPDLAGTKIEKPSLSVRSRRHLSADDCAALEKVANACGSHARLVRRGV